MTILCQLLKANLLIINTMSIMSILKPKY